MATKQRKGLSVRSNIVQPVITFPVRDVFKGPSPPTSNSHPYQSKNTTSKSPFIFFEDPKLIGQCQHCGGDRHTSIKSKTISNTNGIPVAIQAYTDVDLREWLCEENPSDEYWRDLAEQRRITLKETLDENRQLCELVESMNKELDRLTKIEKQVGSFMNSYNNLVDENQPLGE